MFPATIHANKPQATSNRTEQPPQRRGCLLGGLATLLVLLLVIGAGWVLAIRPYVHNLAESQLDSAMGSAVQQIPPQSALLPPGSTLTVTENALTNLVVLNVAPSSPVQQPVAKITPAGVRLEFQLYGNPCAISGVPKAVDGKLVATNVKIEGLVGLVMSPEEFTPLLNKHLANATQKLQHNIQSVELKDGEMDLKIS
jgi:hypothetical protein